MSHKIWFITGASKGFGYIWTEAALVRGDSVAAAARNIGSLDALAAKYGERLLPIRLDVGDKAAVNAAVGKANQQFGRLDIVVNNAGYGLFGAIEEVSEAEARAQLETNLFGALWVTQATLPIMRAQKSGHIIQISSIGGVFAVPTVGLYHASKWGLEDPARRLRRGKGFALGHDRRAGGLPLNGVASAKRAQPIVAGDRACASPRRYVPRRSRRSRRRDWDARWSTCRPAAILGDAGLP